MSVRLVDSGEDDETHTGAAGALTGVGHATGRAAYPHSTPPKPDS